MSNNVARNTHCRYICKRNEEGIQMIESFLSPLIPFLAQCTTSKQLTLCTLLWAFLVIISGYLARSNRLWLLLSLVAVLGHVVTDLLDGALSTYQDDGLEKWNFFMDHILDFVFAISIFTGAVLFLYKKNTKLIIPIFFIFTMVLINMASSFLLIVERGLDLGINVNKSFAFNIFHMHIIIILFYIAFIAFGRNSQSISFALFIVAIFITILTIYNIYTRQNDLCQPE